MWLCAFYYEKFHVESCLVPCSHVFVVVFNPHLPSGLFHLYLIEPCHEIMVLFVLRKLILQMRMRSRPVVLDV